MRCRSSRRFQFHKGTIRTVFCQNIGKVMVYFNSIKVRLEPLLTTITIRQCLYFNSIKVRLELAYAIGLLLAFLFQFHKGTIRTCWRADAIEAHEQFQFHKGTIRTRYARSASSSVSYFNSIKVRLERHISEHKTGCSSFQFHKGTIRTFSNNLF